MKNDPDKNTKSQNEELKKKQPSLKTAPQTQQRTADSNDASSNAALKELAENYLTILDNSLNGTLVVDASTAKILFANRTALDLYGFSSMEEVQNVNLLDYIHPDDRERTFLAFVKDFYENTTHEHYEFRTIAKDGSERLALSHSVPIQYQNKLCGVISFIDITERKKMENTVEASAEKLRAMFESMSEAVTVTDLEGHIIDANPAAVKLHRYHDKKEIIGIKSAELLADRDRERSVKDSIEVLKTKQTHSAEYKLTTKGGTLIDGELSTSVLQDHNGKPAGFIVIGKDISDRKRMEEKLREGERKLDTIYSSLMDGLIITDTMGMVLDANEAAVRIGKYDNVEDLIGRNGLDFIAETELKRVGKAIAIAISDPKQTHSEVIDYIAKDKYGKPFYGETSVSVTRDPSGKPTGMIFVTRDISERKRIDDALKQSEEKFRTLTEDTSDILYSIDTAGNILYIGPQSSRYGMDHEKMVGRSFIEAVHPDDLEQLMKEIIKAVETGIDPTVEFRILDTNGNPHWVEETGRVRRDATGAYIGISGIIRDVTKRKEVEQELHVKERYFRSMMDLSSGAVLVVSPEGTILDTTLGLERISGYSRDKTIGMSALSFINPEDLEKSGAAFVESSQNPGKTVSFEVRCRNAQGDWQWTGAMITNLTGNPDVKGVIVHLYDISERKRLEDKVREDKEKLSATFESMTSGICVIDLQGNAVEVNEAMVKLGGFSARDELIGKNALEFIAPKDRDIAAQHIAKMIKAGQGTDTSEYTFITKDGREFDGEFNIGMIHDKDGKPVNIVAIARDITKRKQAERAVRDSEEKIRSTFDAIGDAVIAMDMNGNLTEFNDSAMRLFGVKSKEETVGMNCLAFIADEDIAAVSSQVAGVLSTGTSVPLVLFKYKRLDGATFYGETSAVALRGTQGNAIGLIAVIRDVTERRRLEEAMRETEERYRSLFDDSLEAIYIADMNGNFTDANPYALKLLGYEKDEINSVNFLSLVDKESTELVYKISEEILRTGSQKEIAEYKLRKKDGTYVWIETTASLLSKAGKLIGLQGIARDITERKKNEATLHETEERYKSLFENSLDAIFTCDLNGNFTDANPYSLKLMGYGKEEISSLNFLSLVDKESSEIAYKIIEEMLKTGVQKEGVEYKLRKKDGTYAWIETTASLLYKAGELIGLQGIARDITERKKTQETLRENEEKYREVVERANDGIIIIQDTIIKYANKRVADIAGYQPEAMIGTSMAVYIHPDELPNLMDRYKRRLAGEAVPQLYETALLHRDGRKIIMELNAGVIKYQGKPADLIIIRDLTERKQAEQALSASEERYRLIAENISDVIWIMDMNLRFTYMSPSIFQLRGYTAEESMKQPIEEAVTPASLKSLTDVFMDELFSEDAKTRDPHRTRTFTAELKHKDGSTVWTEQKISFLLDKDDKPTGIMGVTRDIMERRRIEEVMRASEERYRLLAENISDVIWTMDMNLRWTYISPSVFQLEGYTSEEAMERPVEKTISLGSMKTVSDLFMDELSEEAKSRDPHRTRTFTAEVICKDGSTVWTEQKICFLLDKDNKPTGIMGVTRDITERRKVEEVLRASEERYRILADNISDVIWIMDLNLKYTYVSPSIQSMRGFTPEEFKGAQLAEYMTKESYERSAKQLIGELELEKAGGADPGRVTTMELELKKKDGSWIWAESKLTFLRDKAGTAIGLMGITRDISQRKLIEKVIKESEERYRLLAENISDVIFIMDLNFKYIYLSPSVHQLRGYTVEEAIQVPIEKTMTPASLEIAMKTVTEEVAALKSGNADKLKQITLELELYRKDCSTVWTEMKISGIYDKDGNLTSFLGATRDISVRRRVDEIVRASEEKYRLLADNMLDVVFIVDLNFKFLYMSPSVYQVRGYTAEEAVQIPIEKTVTPASLEKVTKTFIEQIELLKSGKRDPHEATTLEVEQYCKDGSTIWLELKASGLYDKEGNLTSILGVARDISERKRADELIRMKEQELRSVFESMSDALAIMDDNFQIINVNDSASQITGFTREELIGHDAFNWLVQGETDKIHQTLDNRKATGATLEKGDFKVKVKDGSFRDVNVIISNLNDASGKLKGYVAVIRDISERKRLDEALRTSEERLKAIYASMPDALAITDKNMIMVDCNDSALRLGGYSIDQIVGHPGLDILYEDDRQRATDELAKRFMGLTSSERQDYRINTADGSIRYTEISIATLKDAKGEVGGFVCVLRDTTERRKMEEALRASEERLKAIYASMPDALVVTDKNMTIVDCNETALKIGGGYTRDQIIGHPGTDLLWEDDRPMIIDQLTKRLAGQATSERQDYRINTLDGSVLYAEMSIAVLKDAKGEIIGFVTVLRDTTERRKMEEVIRASESRLKAIYASLPDALVISNKDSIIIDCNESAVNLAGASSKEQIIGRFGLDLLHEDDLQRAMNDLGKRMAGESSATRQDYKVRTLDGVIRYTELSIATLKDVAGGPVGFVAILRDTTERRQMEEAIHANERLLSAVFDSMHDGIIVNDKDVKFLRWNQAALDISGFKAEEMLGKPGIELVIPEDRPKVMEEMTKQFLGTATEMQSYRVQLPNGLMKHVELSVSALKDDAGNITGFVSAVRDVTRRIAMERELKKAVDDLQRSNKELEQFAYIASHDLQEPLRMISSYTQLLSKRYTGKLDTNADEFIAYAVDGADRMQKMINDLLTYSRVTTRGKDFVAVDLEKSFSDALDNLKLSIEDNKATITHDPLPKVVADESQMVRLFQNLIGNALKFHGAESPIIHIGCKDGEFDYTVSIKDNGIGIDNQYFNRLFVIFQRLHTRDQYPGTGIGLAVCKRTVERHGGKIWVESEGAGKGSTFLFTIPKRDLTKKTETPEAPQGKNNMIKKE